MTGGEGTREAGDWPGNRTRRTGLTTFPKSGEIEQRHLTEEDLLAHVFEGELPAAGGEVVERNGAARAGFGFEEEIAGAGRLADAPRSPEPLPPGLSGAIRGRAAGSATVCRSIRTLTSP
jgi:hypothetical protein